MILRMRPRIILLKWFHPLYSASRKIGVVARTNRWVWISSINGFFFFPLAHFSTYLALMQSFFFPFLLHISATLMHMSGTGVFFSFSLACFSNIYLALIFFSLAHFSNNWYISSIDACFFPFYICLCQSVCLSVSVSLSVCLSVSVSLFVCLSVCLSLTHFSYIDEHI